MVGVMETFFWGGGNVGTERSLAYALLHGAGTDVSTRTQDTSVAISVNDHLQNSLQLLSM